MNGTENIHHANVSEFLMKVASRGLIPLSGTFELSPVCNFACKMCYVRKSVEEVAQSPRPILQLQEWLRIAEEARDAGMLFLLLTGGEPLLWPDFWNLYDAVYDMGILISINTNGSMIDEKAVEHWMNRPPKRVNITLYGGTDTGYESLCGVRHMCSRVMSAVIALKKAGIQVKLNCSLTPHNAGELEQMIEFAKANDVVIQVSSYMFPPIRRDESSFGINDRFTPYDAAYYHLKQYELQHSREEYNGLLQGICRGVIEPLGLDESCVDPIDGKIRCRAGNASFWISWDGWMTPCGMMPIPKSDVRIKTFTDCWVYTSASAADVPASGICEQCADRQLCHSCTATAYAETGRTNGTPTYQCEMVAAMRRIAEKEIGLLN